MAVATCLGLFSEYFSFSVSEPSVAEQNQKSSGNTHIGVRAIVERGY